MPWVKAWAPAPNPLHERCCIIPGAVKKVYHRSLPFNKRWPPLRKHRICSVTIYGPSYRFKSFDLHKIWRAVRKGQFSALAMITAAITMLSQSLAPLDASSCPLGSTRPRQKSWTLDHRCLAQAVSKRCTSFAGVVVSVFWADTELLERCQALKQRSNVVMNFGLALVWRCLYGTNAHFRYRYTNAIATPASAVHP